jgi:hypothetical protein
VFAPVGIAFLRGDINSAEEALKSYHSVINLINKDISKLDYGVEQFIVIIKLGGL